jgi:inner membrane protein
MLADADALIGSPSDQLLVIEYHRHFSHALAFVPLGALVAALLLWPLLRTRLPARRIYLYTLLGYGVAGLLDACTSYGTHLLWPFSDQRVAWSVIAIVDPLFTLALAAALLIGLRRASALPARAAVAFACAYLLLGAVQHQRALAIARDHAAERGHAAERLVVKPTIGNLLLWRALYVTDSHAHALGVRAGVGDGVRTYPGDTTPLFDLEGDAPWAVPGSRARADIERFARLSEDMLARDPSRPELLGDVRYAMLPTAVEPLWGIVLDPNAPDEHVRFVTNRNLNPARRQALLDMLLGRAVAPGETPAASGASP